MNPAMYLSYKSKADSMQRKLKPTSSVVLLKDKNELLASYQSLPAEDQESIREFLKIVRNDEEQRKKMEEEIRFIRKDRNNSPRLQELIRQFYYFNFEISEQERLLQRQCTYAETSLILTDLQRVDYHKLMSAVQRGFRTGVGNFLEAKSEICLYLGNLREFYLEESTPKVVETEIKKTFSKLNNIYDFAIDVSGKYGTYVYNDSRDRFFNKFGRKH